MEVVRIVEVPEFLRDGEGKMGASEAGSDEEGCTIELSSFAGGFEPTSGFGGDTSICIGFVGDIRVFPRRSSRQAANFVELLVGEEGFFAREFCISSVGVAVFNDQIVEVWNLKGAWVSGVAMSDVEDFAERFGAVAEASKVLREGDCIGQSVAELATEVVEAGSGGMSAEEQCKAGGSADCLAAAGNIEADTALREPVEVWGFSDWVSVATEGGFEVIDEQEEDIGAIGVFGVMRSLCSVSAAKDGAGRDEEQRE